MAAETAETFGPGLATRSPEPKLLQSPEDQDKLAALVTSSAF